MRSRTTRGHRGASPRRGRPTRARGHAASRHYPVRRGGRTPMHHRPAPRRGRYSHSRAAHPGHIKALVAAGVIAAALAAAYYLAVKPSGPTPHGPITGPGTVAGQYIYTARTANDATVTLPGTVRSDLLATGLADQSIALTRVGFTGNVSTSSIDLTPRTSDAPNAPVLKVRDRAVPVIDAKISRIGKTINSSAATATSGGRALYTGLMKTNFTGAPVTIISSGLDLANPDNFRSLQWSVPPGELVAEMKRADDLPALHGPVTFVLVPTAGPQPQLRQAQKNYLQAIWTALLKAGGATSVRFIDATGSTPTAAAPSAPTVPVPSLPSTPIPQVPKSPGKVTCTVPASYFIVNTPQLINTAKTKQDLTPCITAALAAHATFALDGWTSYVGPLDPSGRPARDDPYNRQLSRARVRAIANLLVNDLGVPRSAITHLAGHGNVNQPNPDPASPANRVVIITYTVR